MQRDNKEIQIRQGPLGISYRLRLGFVQDPEAGPVGDPMRLF